MAPSTESLGLAFLEAALQVGKRVEGSDSLFLRLEGGLGW